MTALFNIQFLCYHISMIIYKATNKINGKAYIGQTRTTLSQRKREHKCHKSKKNGAFYNAIKKHGWHNFKWQIVFKAKNIDDLNCKEQIAIQEHNTLAPNGYNLTTGGGNNKVTDEVRQKLSDKAKRQFASKQARKKLSEQAKKQWADPVMRAKMRAGWDAKKDIIIKKNTGRKHTAEARKKMSLAMRGNTNGAGNKNRQFSAETKLKMSISAKKRWSKYNV